MATGTKAFGVALLCIVWFAPFSFADDAVEPLTEKQRMDAIQKLTDDFKARKSGLIDELKEAEIRLKAKSTPAGREKVKQLSDNLAKLKRNPNTVLVMFSGDSYYASVGILGTSDSIVFKVIDELLVIAEVELQRVRYGVGANGVQSLRSKVKEKVVIVFAKPHKLKVSSKLPDLGLLRKDAMATIGGTRYHVFHQVVIKPDEVPK